MNNHENTVDALKAAPLATYGATSWFLGVDWGAVGAFLMAIYAVLLILDKCGLLAPIKAAISERLAKPPEAPPPPVTRNPADE